MAAALGRRTTAGNAAAATRWRGSPITRQRRPTAVALGRRTITGNAAAATQQLDQPPMLRQTLNALGRRTIALSAATALCRWMNLPVRPAPNLGLLARIPARVWMHGGSGMAVGAGLLTPSVSLLLISCESPAFRVAPPFFISLPCMLESWLSEALVLCKIYPTSPGFVPLHRFCFNVSLPPTQLP